MVISISGIREPVSPGLLALLRDAVLLHVCEERRRVFAPTIHVGRPGGPPARLELDGHVVTDHALRVDMLEAMVRRARLTCSRSTTPVDPGALPLVWLSRDGSLDTVQDADLAWSAATRAASGELGLPLAMVVVNRTSWRDPHSGVGRQWKRLRPR